MQFFDCDYVGNMDEYVGCKIWREEGSFTCTQPVMLQSFKDNFDLPTRATNTPGEPGKTLIKSKEGESAAQMRQHTIARELGIYYI